jgi:hypothetical protein
MTSKRTKKVSTKRSPTKLTGFKLRDARSPSKLPRTWRGAEVVRGAGMKGDELDDFLTRKAFDNFDPTREQWLVVEDRALEDLEDSTQMRVFGSKEEALRCAKAQSCGNVDHRVIRLGEQTLVVATMNEL